MKKRIAKKHAKQILFGNGELRYSRPEFFNLDADTGRAVYRYTLNAPYRVRMELTKLQQWPCHWDNIAWLYVAEDGVLHAENPWSSRCVYR